MTCEEVRMSLGAHVLGALEPREALLVEAHLATCAGCRDELEELGGLTAMLAKVGEEDIEQAGRPPHAVLDRLIATSVRRRRLNRAVLGLAASLVVVALGGTAFLALAGDGPGEHASAPAALAQPTPSPAVSADTQGRGAPEAADQPMLATGTAAPHGMASPPQGRVGSDPAGSPAAQKDAAARMLSGERAGVRADLTLTPRGAEGTSIVIRLSGVPDGTSCRVTAVGLDGTKAPAGGWTVDQADYRDGTATFTGQTELSAETIEGFEISTSTGKRLLWLPLR
ncbi:zf-HC2 domain-containing protein [Sphaerisporangium sp. B11E5]|uniref:zf-HC2 domain-containing protein n=1 Tax=Sphaerisporangium sp. B11E5 TaxID=3153563 RepID=UPI00325E6EFC